MTKKFRGLSLAMAVMLMVSVGFTGCGSSKKDDAKATPSSDKSASSTKEQLKPVELVWYQVLDPKAKDEQVVFDELNKYLKEKINATVKQNILTWADYSTKVPVVIASGQPFDICWTSAGMNPYISNVAKGAYAPMNDLLNKYAKETKEFIPGSFWDAIKIKGEVYAVPTYKEMGQQVGYMINTDIATKYGLDISTIKKYGDLEPMLKTIKEKDPNIIPFLSTDGLFAGAYPNYDPTNTGVGISANVPGIDAFKGVGGKLFNSVETPEYMEYCKTMNKWWKLGYTVKDPVQYGKDNSRDTDDKAGKLFSWMISYAPAYAEARAKQMGHGVAFVPLHKPVFSTSNAMGGMQAISKNSSNPERAMMFLNLVNTDIKVGTMLRHGIEGKHYVKVGDQLDRTAVPGLDVKNHPYDYVFGWQFGTVFNQVWDVSYPKNVKDIFMDYNKSSISVDTLGFVFNVEPVQAEISALRNVNKEFSAALGSGMVDPEVYIPKYIEKLKANGFDKLLTESQTQLDKWKAESKK